MLKKRNVCAQQAPEGPSSHKLPSGESQGSCRSGDLNLVLILQDDEADSEAEHAEDPPGLQKKESKLASFSWASRLSGTSSSGASLANPGLLQSLTGTIAGSHSYQSPLQYHVLHRQQGACEYVLMHAWHAVLQVCCQE